MACDRVGIARVYGCPRETVNARSGPVNAGILLPVTTGGTANETSKPPCLREDALAVLTRLRDAGHVAYFAGGCVRDELLGLTPKDYDVATDAPPDRVRKLFTNTQAVGAAFGVILVRHKRSTVEVATFRTDGTYLDGRRPEAVTFTTAEEDAKRRDFTINGLFLDPVENKVIDYVGGREDLKNKVLRAIGDPNHRFEEDHLRVLRAVRFAARFYLGIEPATADAISRHAPHLTRISPERIAEELRLMLVPPTRCDAWVRLGKFGVDRVIFRHWPLHDRSDGSGKVNLVMCKLGDEPASLGLALSAAMIAFWPPRDTEEEIRRCFEPATVTPAVNAVRRALRISNAESEEMSGSLLGLQPLLAAGEATLAQKKRFLMRATGASSRRLMRALASSGYFPERVRGLERELDQLEATDFAPPPLVTGDDLTDSGLRPGPRFKVALDQTYDAQLERRVTSRKDAIEMAVRIAKGESV